MGKSIKCKFKILWWRLTEQWQKIKDFFARHTTVKPRHLGHGWCDVSELHVHTTFELMTRFQEEIKQNDYIDWSWVGKIVDGRTIPDIVDELVEWYEDVYLPYTLFEQQSELMDMAPDGYYDFRWEKVDENYHELSKLEIPEDDEMYGLGIQEAIHEYELRIEQEAHDNLCLIAKIRLYLWT